MDKVIKNFQNISYGPAPEDNKEVNSWIKNLKNPKNSIYLRDRVSGRKTFLGAN